jgi:hypothetical protein
MRISVVVSVIAGFAGIAALPIVAAADDIELPARKAGQWQIEMDAGAGPTMTMQLCLDAATDKDMMQAGLALSKGMCTRIDTARTGDTITIDAACTMGAMKTTSHTVITGDFQSSYTVETASDIEGGPKGMPAHSTITQHVTWTGDCANGLQPGEMSMPGGMKINVQQMMKGAGGG